MALQGTLETFALPDVLRLLATTKKTGQYRLEGDRGSGSLWVRDGQIVGGEVPGAPNAKEPAEVAFELLRFGDGDFEFLADVTPDTESAPVDVESVLTSAESLLEEWKEIEAVVPSLDHWVALQPELEGDEVTIRADKWISVVAIGSGTTVGRLGAVLGLGELPVSRTVKELVEAGLVQLTATAPAGANLASDAFVTPAEPAASLVDEPEGFVDDAAVIEFAPVGADVAPVGDDEYEPFDPNGLVIEEPRIPTVPIVVDDAPAAEPDVDLSDSSTSPRGPLHAGGEADPTDAAEIARQLANLSPKAAKAVAAAAKATTQEEREAALAEVDESEDPINRELLLKFLGSVNS